ncbi:MAG: putative DNA binding domain-containing protein [Bacteroidales bacterium]|nr:putative DNA binding domain-containing protein [Bacteroidales bacterium]
MAKNLEKSEMQVFKADLHIHTPASKCYKGSKDDAEYIRIIEKAEEKGLKIVAITDHNSIEGYERLIEQKERIRVEVEGFRTLNDSKEAKKKVKEGERILKLFNTTLILPGVEFEVRNGVHMLVIFNPQTEIATIKDFLKKGGFEDESFGKEDDVFSNWDLFDFYNEASKYDCLIFDAHTDSNKGIYKTITGGTTRIHAFVDKSLVGICYKNEKQKCEIRNLFSQPDYKRTNPIAFLKASDAHKTEEIGKEKTFFQLKDLNWQNFKNAFNNPDECIFTSNPNTQIRINNLSSTGRCVFVPELNDSHKYEFAEAVCGLSNADGGYIVIGAESKDVVVGIAIKKKSDIDKIQDYLDEVSKKTRVSYLNFNLYLIKDDFYVVVVKVDRGDELIDVEKNGIIYYCQKGENEKLDANQIQQVVSQRLETKYQQHISKELAIVRKSASAIETYLKSRPILSSYNKISTSIYNVSSLKEIEPTKLTPEQKQSLSDRFKEQENGFLKGNIMFIDGVLSPRLKQAYLRITPPKFTLKGIRKVSDKKYLYITPGGAVFYSESELNYHNNKDYSVLKIEVLNNYSIKFLCAFLKSSFFLWYVKNQFDVFDFYPAKIFNYINVPSLHPENQTEMNLISKIETRVDSIIELERDFFKTDLKTIKNTTEYVDRHNKNTETYFKEIDNLIFELLRIKEEDVLIIKENLRANYIYVPE